MELSKRKLRIGTATATSIILIGAIYLFIGHERVVKDPTICISENRRLSETELRERALLSYIENNERISREYKKRGNPIGDVMGGIIEKKVTRDDLALSMREISAKDVAFTEALSIKPLPKNMSILASMITENQFTYVSYDIKKDGDARFFPTSTFQLIDEIKDLSNSITFSEKKKGFGTFFFMVDNYPIRKACCDNERNSDEPHDYYSKKLYATESNISYLTNKNVNQGKAVAATGCGQILTHKKLNGSYVIKYFYIK